MNYLVVGSHQWNKDLFLNSLQYYEGEWAYFDGEPDKLEWAIEQTEPDYIFFLHWSHKVPDHIVNNFECICFHPSDLPYGRGGTPIQNLILAGHEYTYLTAFRMIGEIDAGPIYDKTRLSLKGTAHEIYKDMMVLAKGMIVYIITTKPTPRPQEGTATYFVRRKPEESQIPDGLGAKQLYDFIRMLDAPGYPHAFIACGDYNTEMTKAKLSGNDLIVEAKIINVCK
jgi:methionyl-tRNA formyltransferase